MLPAFQYNVFSTDNYNLFYEYDVSSGFNYIIKYSDTIGIKKDLIFVVMILSFILKLQIQRGCISRSNIATTFGDDMPPDIPIIKDVSVNSNGQSVNILATNNQVLEICYLP